MKEFAQNVQTTASCARTSSNATHVQSGMIIKRQKSVMKSSCYVNKFAEMVSDSWLNVMMEIPKTTTDVVAIVQLKKHGHVKVDHLLVKANVISLFLIRQYYKQKVLLI